MITGRAPPTTTHHPPQRIHPPIHPPVVDMSTGSAAPSHNDPRRSLLHRGTSAVNIKPILYNTHRAGVLPFPLSCDTVATLVDLTRFWPFFCPRRKVTGHAESGGGGAPSGRRRVPDAVRVRFDAVPCFNHDGRHQNVWLGRARQNHALWRGWSAARGASGPLADQRKDLSTRVWWRWPHIALPHCSLFPCCAADRHWREPPAPALSTYVLSAMHGMLPAPLTSFCVFFLFLRISTLRSTDHFEVTADQDLGQILTIKIYAHRHISRHHWRHPEWFVDTVTVENIETKVRFFWGIF